MITSLVEERAGLYASRALNVYLACVTFFVFYSSSWCLKSAAGCDCGTPWTFYLTFSVNTVIPQQNLVFAKSRGLPLGTVICKGTTF